MSPSREIAESRAMLLLAAQEITEAQLRDACILLAGLALDATGGDWDAAKQALHPVLEMVGAVEYEAALPRTMWGAPQKPGGARDA